MSESTSTTSAPAATRSASMSTATTTRSIFTSTSAQQQQQPPTNDPLASTLPPQQAPPSSSGGSPDRRDPQSTTAMPADHHPQHPTNAQRAAPSSPTRATLGPQPMDTVLVFQQQEQLINRYEQAVQQLTTHMTQQQEEIEQLRRAVLMQRQGGVGSGAEGNQSVGLTPQPQQQQSPLPFPQQQQTPLPMPPGFQPQHAHAPTAPTVSSRMQPMPTMLADGALTTTTSADPTNPLPLSYTNANSLPKHWHYVVEEHMANLMKDHMKRMDEKIALSIAQRLRRVTKEHVEASVHREVARYFRDAKLDGKHALHTWVTEREAAGIQKVIPSVKSTRRPSAQEAEEADQLKKKVKIRSDKHSSGNRFSDPVATVSTKKHSSGSKQHYTTSSSASLLHQQRNVKSIKSTTKARLLDNDDDEGEVTNSGDQLGQTAFLLSDDVTPDEYYTKTLIRSQKDGHHRSQKEQLKPRRYETIPLHGDKKKASSSSSTSVDSDTFRMKIDSAALSKKLVEEAVRKATDNQVREDDMTKDDLLVELELRKLRQHVAEVEERQERMLKSQAERKTNKQAQQTATMAATTATTSSGVPLALHNDYEWSPSTTSQCHCGYDDDEDDDDEEDATISPIQYNKGVGGSGAPFTHRASAVFGMDDSPKSVGTNFTIDESSNVAGVHRSGEGGGGDVDEDEVRRLIDQLKRMQ